MKTFEIPKLDAHVYLIAEGSDGDPVALRAIKDWIRRTADESGAGVIHMDDKIAVVELPMIITITDPESRKMMGLPPVASPVPSHFRDSDEG